MEIKISDKLSNDKQINKAFNFAEEKHRGQKRKGGQAYIIHPVWVAEYLADKNYGKDYILAALFHDLLEDTDATEEEIVALSNKNVLSVVKLLTKNKNNFDMGKYIEKIKNNEIALTVKCADRLHNVLSLSEADDSFRKRYIKDTKIWFSGLDKDLDAALKTCIEKYGI